MGHDHSHHVHAHKFEHKPNYHHNDDDNVSKYSCDIDAATVATNSTLGVSTLSSMSVVSRPAEYTMEKLSRFSSCPAANNTMSLITPTISGTVTSSTLTTSSPNMIGSKSYSQLPRSISATTRRDSKGGQRRRRSSLLIVHNGITGKYISSRICKIAAKFWHANIEKLSMDDQLEIGCSIFFGMLASSDDMKAVMKNNFNDSAKMESTSLKYLDMMGWLIRYLVTDNIDLYALLTRLGVIHRSMGIGIQHFTPMLSATHETLSYYFESKYSIEVKYAMDEIFSLSAQLMTGQPLKRSAHLNNITEQFNKENIPFLANLDVCIESSVGQEYLYRYLAQTWCDEIAIFLKSIQRFKRGLSNKERFMIAREITKASIDPAATFSLNLSYDNRKTAMFNMSKLEMIFMAKKELKVETDFFYEVEKEIRKLILDNHWNKFVDGIESLQFKSFVVD